MRDENDRPSHDDRMETGESQLSGLELEAGEDRSTARRWIRRAEEILPVLALAAMTLLPLAEIVARRLGTGVPGAASFTQHLTLWVTFLGAALAAREGKLLSLATTSFWREGPWRRFAEIFAGAVGAGVTAILFRASLELVDVEREFGSTLALDVPVWLAQAVMPVGFALIALRLAWRASERWWGRFLGFAGLGIGLWLGQMPGLLEGRPDWPGVALILVATALGSPIFAVLGGFAVLFFMTDGVPLAAVPSETYRLATSPLLAAIPLFTLTGFLLAEGDSSRRLVRVFRAWFGF
ncbi:MAG: TRAP transporter small permease, partial [Thermoanaerobaculia bacterium]|nr:TRAP transporter small permease [Thermoanaerobaculia bacterium]